MVMQSCLLSPQERKRISSFQPSLGTVRTESDIAAERLLIAVFWTLVLAVVAVTL